MKNFDPVKFEELIDAGKRQEAENYVGECLDMEISSGESGKILLSYTLAYMKAVNSINEAYKAQLEDILEAIRDIKQLGKDGEDRINLLKVRSDLNS